MVTYLMPIETTVRELDYKLLLAARLKAPNRRFIFCRDDLAPQLLGVVSRGIYIGQNIRSRAGAATTAERYRRLRSAGFRLIHLDEEGAVYPGQEPEWAYWVRQRMGDLPYARPDTICTWGRFQAAILNAQPSTESVRIAQTGHPRFDLCGAFLGAYRDEIAAIRRKYGEYCLINTNFGAGNSVLGTKEFFSNVEGYQPHDSGRRLAWVREWRTSACGPPLFIGLIHEICGEFSEMQFVVRPHPSEDHDLYRAATRGLRNVTVDATGSVIAMAAASRAMIHNGCTTAIEGHLAGARVLCYCPPEIGRGSTWIASIFGSECTSAEEIRDALRSQTVREAKAPDSHAADSLRAAGLIEQLRPDYPPGESLERFCALAVELEGSLDSTSPQFSRQVVRALALKHAIRARIAGHVEGVKRIIRNPGRIGIARRNAQKFFGFTRPELEGRAAALGRVFGREMSVEVLSPTLAIIE